MLDSDPQVFSRRLAVLTPSRGRPGGLAAMIDAICETAAGPVELYVGLDEDNAEPYLHSGALADRGPVRVHYQVHRRRRLAGWTNHLAEWALRDGHTILAFFGDDHRPRTHGWDERVRAVFDAHGSGLVYCADGLQDQNLPTAPFWSADVIRALGFYYPPPLTHMYADNYWLRLARDLGRCRYLGDVMIEHLHPSAGKAAYDDTYRENDFWINADRDAFMRFVHWEHPDLLLHVQRVLAADEAVR